MEATSEETSSHARELLKLALPIVTVQIGLMLMGVVDTMMVGRVSAEALAAVALGNVYWYMMTIFGLGVLMALDPVIAQAVGAEDHPAIARGLQRGLVLSAIMTVLGSVLLLFAEPALTLAKQPADVVPGAAVYARIGIWGLLPFFVYTVLRQSLQAMNRVREIVIMIVLANVGNVLLNWVFIFGKLGFPAMGVAGAAWATAISRWVMALGLIAMSWRVLAPYLDTLRPESLERGPLGRMFRLGAPIGIQYQLEFGVFAAVALLMGRMGTAEVAGHQIALNLASLTFMVPMGVGAAAAVLVGQGVGRGDVLSARAAARTSLVTGVGFMAFSAVVLLLFPEAIARLYTTDLTAAALAIVLIPIAGVFQVFDGMQVVIGGVLRGLGDTHTPMVVNIVGFWLIGLPISMYLGFRTSLGPSGLWWGLVVGLAAVATILLLRLRLSLRKEMTRVVIDRP